MIITLGFAIWMWQFDDNSIKIHRELNREINKLEASIDFYKNEIDKDQKMIDDYDNPEKLEKFARETYQMKKDSEDIFLIVYDSLPKK